MLRIAAIVLALAAGFASAQAADKVRFGTNWVAEAEHGGFYQALADGTYAKYGLDITIVPGGPNVNNRILLPVGKLDFFMSANTLQSFDAVEHDIPTVVVAASFQKDPQVLIAHPGVNDFADLKKLTLFVSKEGMVSYFQWLKKDYGFSEAKVKPYTFNPQPFLADKSSAMQGYVTSEPYAIETQGHFAPKVFLLADHGFNAYSTLIETRRDLIEKQPDLVQRFVDASAIGWYHYIYGDSRPGNEAIKKQNPEMTDALLAYSIGKMKQYGIVDSGDTLKLGIGAMTDERMKNFFDKMVRAGVVKESNRLQARLYAAIRQQGRRRRSAAEMSRQGAIVSLRGVGKAFERGTVALEGFDLDVRDGEFVSLLGPSGCGKSTALRIIAGLSAPSSGTVEWPADNLEDRNRAGPTSPGKIGFVFQEPTLMPWATVAANVRLPLKLVRDEDAASRKTVARWLERVGLVDFAQSYPRELSGGMRMRVSIARALVTEPQLLLMDEPFAALDEITRFKLNNELAMLWHELRRTVIFVTHSVFELVYLSQRIVVMTPRPGRVFTQVKVPVPYPRDERFRTSAEYAAYCRRVAEALSQAMGGGA